MSGRRQNTNHRQKVRRAHFQDAGHRNEATMAKIANQLRGTGIVFRPTNQGYRFECGQCPWNEDSRSADNAVRHATSH